MDSYKASKAWHISHNLATDVHELARGIPHSDHYNLNAQLRRASATVPTSIAESVEHALHHKKLECYHLARDAVVELQEQLQLARDRSYVDQQTFEDLAGRAISTYHVLTSLIRSTKQSLTATE
ncbi:MAG: hypothetical protein JWO35_451 [Candidatus Saccharibacteria bacterium]|nr:hypothetical protein [Candidatus Saccharibacteria bacterium]